MTTADGSVIGVTQIVNHGSPARRWNLVLLSDGYQLSELGLYATHAQAFVDALRVTPPFDAIWCAINVFRVDVSSTDSGTDDPLTCSDGSTGSGATPRTYFDSTLCYGGVRRLLVANSATALATARAQVPQTTRVVALVNTTLYGGSGGNPVGAYAAAHSPQSTALDVAVHELGHTAFDLADEYESCTAGAANRYTGPEPDRPNITTDANRATTKWRSLIAATTAVPTQAIADCTDCSASASPVAAGTVGLFEGGGYWHCGIYRPEYDCKMRRVGPALCAVCQARVRQVLGTYRLPDVELLTPSIDFGGVPIGVTGSAVTTYRAIRFEVRGCGVPATLRVAAGPTGGFTVPTNTGPQVVATSSSSTMPVTARLWIAYTSSTVGATAGGTVTIECVETSQTWSINLAARTIARPRSEVALVLDHSGSMSEDAGDGTRKVDKLRRAANAFIDLMLPGDGLAVVRFDDTAQIIMPVADVGPVGTGAGRITAQGLINGPQLDPAGWTSIGGGITQGTQALTNGAAAASPPYAVRAMLVLTDGMENSPPTISTASSSLTANAFAIGFGTGGNVDVGKLNALTQNNGGYLLVTGAITPDWENRLAKYFLQILGGISNANVVLDPQGVLGPGEAQRIPFNLTEADHACDVILLGSFPRNVGFALETPGGDRIDVPRATAEPTVEYVGRPAHRIYRLSLPALPAGAHEGRWHVLLDDANEPTGREFELEGGDYGIPSPYDLVVHAYSALTLQARLGQASVSAGKRTIRAVVSEFGVPLASRASVWAEVRAGNGAPDSVAFAESGEGRFDGEVHLLDPGVSEIRVRAEGVTLRGEPFTREQTLTAVVIEPGLASEGAGICCDALRDCVAYSIRERRFLWWRWASLDLRRLRECLADHAGAPH